MKMTLCDRCGEIVNDYIISVGYNIENKDLCKSCAVELTNWFDHCPKSTHPIFRKVEDGR